MATEFLSDIEEWRPVPGWEGLYEISLRGAIRKIAGSRRYKSGYVLKHRRNRSGHLFVGLTKDGHHANRWVHKLLLEAFYGPAKQGQIHTAHGDGNPENNDLDNLRWATPAENYIDSIRHGTAAIGEKHPFAKLTADIVRSIRAERQTGGMLETIAAVHGVSRSTVARICRGSRWRHVSNGVGIIGPKWMPYTTKLTEDEVRSIRHTPGRHAVLAALFGVSPSQIGYIKSKRYWPHVPDIGGKSTHVGPKTLAALGL